MTVTRTIWSRSSSRRQEALMVARRYLSDVLALPDQSVSVSPGVPAGPLPTR